MTREAEKVPSCPTCHATAVSGCTAARDRDCGLAPPAAPSLGENPKDRIGDTKVRLSLVPGPAVIAIAKVMTLGAKKYGPYNWRQNKVRRTVYLEAALRHILAALDGEDADPESGQMHEAHAASCMAIILDASATGNLVDDRPTPGVAGALLR